MYERRIAKNLEQKVDEKKEAAVMRNHGVLLLLLTIALSGTIVLNIKQNRVQVYGTITMVASFDDTSQMDRYLMTRLTGTGICIVFLLLGISMIIQAKKWILN